MKKTVQLFILVLLSDYCIAQNLVLNGDFEQYTSCPSAYGQVDSASYWLTPTTGGTSDYLNSCAPAISHVSVPVNFDCNSYQPAHSGNGYTSIINYSDNGASYREYIEATLSAPLVMNTCYEFQMYINLVNCCKYAADGLGIYFSPVAVTNVNTTQTLSYVPQISNASMNYFTDTANWVLFNGTYTAQGGEQYLIIGNFKDDQNTNRIIVNSAYYYPNNFIYVDDVSLSVCTGINEQTTTDEFGIYPNPAKELLVISDKALGKKVQRNSFGEIEIYDLFGRTILKSEVGSQKSEMTINISKLSPGIYFLIAGNEVRKFVKE